MPDQQTSSRSRRRRWRALVATLATSAVAATLAVPASAGPPVAAAVPRGGVSGVVSLPVDADPALLADVAVVLTEITSWDAVTVTVGSDGSWSAPGLADGEYVVQVDAPEDSDLVDEYYDDAVDFWDAQPVVVAGAPVTGIDVELAWGGSVSGAITVPEGYAPDEVSVTLQSSVGSYGWGFVQADGTWVARGLAPGEYVVSFEVWGSDLQRQYFDGVTSATSATPVVVAARSRTTGIDAALTVGGRISGTVRVPAGHEPSDVHVSLVSDDDEWYGGAVGTDGTWSVGGLPDGAYTVQFQDYTGLLPQWWDGARTEADATQVVLSGGGTVTGIDADLALGGTIAGRLTVPEGVDPTEVYIWVVSEGDWVPSTQQVEPDGSYVVRGLATGSYRVQFLAPEAGLVAEYWDDVATYDEATPVAVVEGRTTGGVDATLEAGGSITGTVMSADGPVAGASVDVEPFDPSLEDYGYAETGKDGSFVVTGLRAGDYRVRFHAPQGSELVGEYYDDATSWDDAAAVAVAHGRATTLRPAVLDPGASVTGTVRDAAGDPLPGVVVSAMSDVDFSYGDAVTGDDGTYRVAGLDAGAHVVRLEPEDDSSNLAAEFWDDAARRADATEVLLRRGVTRGGVDAVLEAGASVSGVVTGAGGAPVADAAVYVQGLDSMWFGRVADTDDAGRYQVVGLPAGRYVVLAEPRPGEGLAPRYWRDSGTPAGAEPVQVGAGQVRTGVDLVLPRAGLLTGTVAVAPGHDYVCVAAYVPTAAEPSATSCSSVGERWELEVATGSYVVEATAMSYEDGGTTLDHFHRGATRRGLATPVAVTAGATVPVDLDLRSVGLRGTAFPDLQVTIDPATPVPGRPSTITVLASGDAGTPTGVVDLRTEREYLGEAVLSGGRATLQHTFSAADEWVFLSYRGSTTYDTAWVLLDERTGATEPAPVTFTFSSSAPTVRPGEPVTLTVRATSPYRVPEGLVRLSAGSSPLATVALHDGVARLSVDDLPEGTHRLVATYEPFGPWASATAATTQVVRTPGAPVVSRVEPPSGSLLGGTQIRVLGSGFTGATAVSVGGAPATSLTVVSDGELRAVTPAGARGDAPVVVTTPVGSSGVSAAATFRYVDYVTHAPRRAVSDLSVPPDTVRCVAIGGAGDVPAAATGVIMNVTTVRPDGLGYVVVYPDTDGTGRTAPPAGSTVNFERGADVANATFVELPANGKVCYATKGAKKVGVLLDVSGYVLPGSGIVTQAPRRLLDTRPDPRFHVGTVTGPVAPRAVQTVQVRGEAGVPADASAVILNVTVTGPTTNGNLRVFPAGLPVPNTSVVNFAPGKDKANGTIVDLPASGKISFWSDSPAGVVQSPVNVVLDVVGYVAAETSFTGIAPTRLVDTRPSPLRVGTLAGPLKAATPYTVTVAGQAGVPTDATAVALNVTAIGPTTLGNLRVYPDSTGDGATPPPPGSSVNYIPGRATPNMVVVALPASGRVTFWSDQGAGGTVQLAVDVVGYVTAD